MNARVESGTIEFLFFTMLLMMILLVSSCDMNSLELNFLLMIAQVLGFAPQKYEINMKMQTFLSKRLHFCKILVKIVSECLPQILLDVAGELGFLSPAVTLEGLADVGLDIGGEGTGAVVVLVIAFAGIDGDEVVLDGTFHATRHVVVSAGETVGHADWGIVAVFRTVVALHLGIGEVDAGDTTLVLGDISAEDVAEAMVAKGTAGAVAYEVVRGFFAKDFFARLGGNLFLFHHVLLFWWCKVSGFVEYMQIFQLEFYLFIYIPTLY